MTIFSQAISVSILVDMASGKLKYNVFYLSRDFIDHVNKRTCDSYVCCFLSSTTILSNLVATGFAEKEIEHFLFVM